MDEEWDEFTGPCNFDYETAAAAAGGAHAGAGAMTWPPPDVPPKDCSTITSADCPALVQKCEEKYCTAKHNFTR